MKQIKVSEASDVHLNHLIAKIEGHEWRCPWMLQKDGYAAWQGYEHGWGNPTPEYTTDWAQMGPIIEREIDYTDRTGALWQAVKYDAHGNFTMGSVGHFGLGPTPLIAAARCYVTAKLGETVEVPEELLS